ncbi:MAG TPA: hypothetical protein VGJ94_04930 [Syntrophorhabdaceae bacterium]
MAKHAIKAASAADTEMSQAMRKVRKGVVSSIMSTTPRVSAAKWLQEKDASRGPRK